MYFFIAGSSKPRATQVLLQDRSPPLHYQTLSNWSRVHQSRYHDSAQYNERRWNRQSHKNFRTSGKNKLCPISLDLAYLLVCSLFYAPCPMLYVLHPLPHDLIRVPCACPISHGLYSMTYFVFPMSYTLWPLPYTYPTNYFMCLCPMFYVLCPFACALCDIPYISFLMACSLCPIKVVCNVLFICSIPYVPCERLASHPKGMLRCASLVFGVTFDFRSGLPIGFTILPSKSRNKEMTKKNIWPNAAFAQTIVNICTTRLKGNEFQFEIAVVRDSVNPFTPSSGQVKIQEKCQISFSNSAKQIVPCEGTTKVISFKWWHHSISSTYSQKSESRYMSP